MNPNQKPIIREVPVTRFAIAKRLRLKAASQAMSLASTDSRPYPVTHAAVPKHGRALLAHLLTCFIHESSVTIEKAYTASVWLEWLESLDTLAADNEAAAAENVRFF